VYLFGPLYAELCDALGSLSLNPACSGSWWPWGEVSLNVTRVSFVLGTRGRYPARAHDEEEESGETTYQSHQQRDTI
jgi:hypothetical protein